MKTIVFVTRVERRLNDVHLLVTLAQHAIKATPSSSCRSNARLLRRLLKLTTSLIDATDVVVAIDISSSRRSVVDYGHQTALNTHTHTHTTIMHSASPRLSQCIANYHRQSSADWKKVRQYRLDETPRNGRVGAQLNHWIEWTRWMAKPSVSPPCILLF